MGTAGNLPPPFLRLYSVLVCPLCRQLRSHVSKMGATHAASANFRILVMLGSEVKLVDLSKFRWESEVQMTAPPVSKTIKPKSNN